MLPPIFATPISFVSVGVGLPAFTTILDLKVMGQAGITLSMTKKLGRHADDFHLNGTRFSLSTVALDAGEAEVIFKATDDRSACITVNATFVGGCFAEMRVRLLFVGFVGCPEAERILYLEATEASKSVKITPPLLPSSREKVFPVFHHDTNQTEYGVGRYVFVYWTSSVDVGSSPICSSALEVRRGFNLYASKVRHVLYQGQSLSRDFVLESFETVAGMLTLTDFTVSGTGFDYNLAFGILGEKAPFTLIMPSKIYAVLHVNLVWCSTGTLDGSETELAPLRVSIRTSNNLQFDTTSSSILTSTRCIRITGHSEPLMGQLYFQSVDISITSNNDTQTQGRRSLTTYYAQPGSSIYVEYKYREQNTLTVELLHDQYLFLEDVIPPEWTGCPFGGRYSFTVGPPSYSINATWQEPSVFDNVEISSMEQTLSPGATIQLLDSPLEVQYVARDTAGLVSSCAFEIHLDYEEAIQKLVVPFPQDFKYATSAIPFQSSFFVDYTLIDPYAKEIDFAADLSNFNTLLIQFVALPGDIVEVKNQVSELEDVIGMYFDLSLSWIARSTASSGHQFYHDATVELRLVGLNVSHAVACIPPTSTFAPSPGAVRFDQETGAVLIRFRTLWFTCPFTFERLEVKVEYPMLRLPTAHHEYQLERNSFVRLVQECSSDTVRRLGVIIQDLVPPEFQGCPVYLIAPTGPGLFTAAFTWDTPTYFDDRQLATTDPLTLQLIDPSGVHTKLELINSIELEFVPMASPIRDYTLIYTAWDAYGNTADCIQKLTVIDDQAPLLNCQNITLPASANSNQAEVSRDQANCTISDNTNDDITFLSPEEKFELSIGKHLVVVRVQDSSGNEASDEIFVDVEDLESPTVTCPQRLSFVEKIPGTGVIYDWIATYDDNNGKENSILESSHGSQFEAGTTTVLITVRDEAGNLASCSFMVTVETNDQVQAASASKASDSESTAYIGVGAGMVVLLATILALVLYRHHQRAHAPADWDQIFGLIEQLREKGDVCAPRELPRSNLTILEELGKGAFGAVYKGLLEIRPHPAYLVAVKSLHESLSDGGSRRELLEEAAVMAQLDHKNIVKLVGVVTVGKPIYVVIEFCEHGSLKAYLEGNDPTLHQQLHFCLDSAQGLEHIHSVGFVHRDVAARNVLLGSDMTCKIADFGLAREESENGEEAYYRSKSSQIPIRWYT